MKRVAVIGGGISGLSAAYALEQQRRVSAEIDYTLFESTSRLGGVVHTESVEGCLIEAGPDSFLSEKPWATELCGKLGLTDQLIGSNDSERKTYILVREKLRLMPDGLMFMVPTKIWPTLLSPIFSVHTKLRMAREWFTPPVQSEREETVASFVRRHYGDEMVDRIADPLLAGIYGGEASQLSVGAVLPRFVAMEAKYGSLGRAMISARKKMQAAQIGASRPLFTSLKNGMQQMINALVDALPKSAVRLEDKALSLEECDRSWVVSSRTNSECFDAVILAVPAYIAAEVLSSAASPLALELASIPYSSSVTVALGFDGKVRDMLPHGFGFLIPRSENKRMMAVTFVHSKFSHRAPSDRALLRCFLGGSQGHDAVLLSDHEILKIARDELRQIVGLNTEPLFARVYRWKSAMAQYTVGHLDRVQRVAQRLKLAPGIFLAGNGYGGIGVPDCVRSGEEAAAHALSYLSQVAGGVPL